MKAKVIVSRMFKMILPLFFVIPEIVCSEEVASNDFYPNPGIVAFRGGKWVGSDHLYNLTNKIDIVVEIIKGANSAASFTEEQIKARVVDIFKKANIQPMAESVGGRPPLPFLHFLIMLQPVEKGFAVFCEGRLFEPITLERIRLDEQTIMQGITWETQNFVVVPNTDLVAQVNKSVDEIANTFVTRYQFYENIKSQVQKK